MALSASGTLPHLPTQLGVEQLNRAGCVVFLTPQRTAVGGTGRKEVGRVRQTKETVPRKNVRSGPVLGTERERK